MKKNIEKRKSFLFLHTKICTNQKNNCVIIKNRGEKYEKNNKRTITTNNYSN